MPEVQEIKFAIITPTYWKLDGSTKAHLTDTLKSVAAQTYPHYKVFLIGDDYSKEDEFFELAEILDRDKIYAYNLDRAVEREKYEGKELWACGGVNASNTGLKQAISEGYEWICCLDHDDVYFPEHLDVVADCIKQTGTNFVVTKCSFLPEIETESDFTPFIPVSGKLFHLSGCYNYRHYPVVLRGGEETRAVYGNVYAADADKWNRIGRMMTDMGECGVFVNKTTCRKIGGKVPINNPGIVK